MKVRLSFSAIERVTPERDPENILKKYIKKIYEKNEKKVNEMKWKKWGQDRGEIFKPSTGK